jgi:hypothetical protein
MDSRRIYDRWECVRVSEEKGKGFQKAAQEDPLQVLLRDGPGFERKILSKG